MSRRNRWQGAWALLAGLLVASGIPGAAGTQIFQETFEKTYSLNPSARFRLKNQDGSVWIYGANVSEMKVRALKKAYRKDRLEQINVNVVVRPDVVTIETTFPAKPKWGLSDRSGTVDYVIILPWFCDVEKVELGAGEVMIEGMRGNEVQAELGSGRMFGRNCYTDMRLSLAVGDLAVAYDWWESQAVAVNARNGNGNMQIFIPRDAQFRLHAETADGLVLTDFANEGSPANRKSLELAIGDNPNGQMRIQAVNGSITVKEINR